MRASMLLLMMAGMAVAHEHVGDGDFLDYDLSSVKSGQWIEREFTSEWTDDDDKKHAEHTFIRTACVRANDTWLSIEETTWDAAHPDDKTVTQYLVRRSDRLVTQAWRGKAGGKGEAVKVCKSLPVVSFFPEGTTVSGKVTPEKTEIAGKEIEVQKIEVTVIAPGGKDPEAVELTWIDKSASFPIRWDDPSIQKRLTQDAKLDKAVEGSAAIVRSEVTFANGFRKSIVSASGDDAKPTLTTK